MTESFKGGGADPKIGEVIQRIQFLKGKFSSMGRNNSEFPDLNSVAERMLKGKITHEDANKELDRLEEEKDKGDYN